MLKLNNQTGDNSFLIESNNWIYKNHSQSETEHIVNQHFPNMKFIFSMKIAWSDDS